MLEFHSYHSIVKLAKFVHCVFWVLSLVATVSACGERVEPASRAERPSRPAAAAPEPTVPAPVATSNVPYSDPRSAPVSSSIPDSTVPQQQFSLGSDLGAVSGQIPLEAGPDPLEATFGAPPDFISAVKRWVISDSCRLIVVLQNVAPLYPERELVSTIESGGLTWNVYDGGPEDGSEISAVTTVGKLSISVSGQTLFKDRPSDHSTESVVVSVAKSITATDVIGNSK